MSQQIFPLPPSSMSAGLQKPSPSQEVAQVGGEFAKVLMAPAAAALERAALPVDAAAAAASGGSRVPEPGRGLPLPQAITDDTTSATATAAWPSTRERPAGEASDETTGDAAALPLVLTQPVDVPVPPVTAAPPGANVISRRVRPPAEALTSEAPESKLEPVAASPGRTASETALMAGTAEEAGGAAGTEPPPAAHERGAPAHAGLDLAVSETATRVRSVRPRLAREEAAARIEAAFGLRAEPTSGAETGVNVPEGPGLILPPTEVHEVRTPAATLSGPAVALDGAKWQEQFVQRLTLAMNDGLREARIIVDPPELGPLDMKIGMSGGETQVQFTAYQASTRELLEEAMPRLREMFDAAGLKLSDADVRQGGQQAGDGERFARGSGPAGGGPEGDPDLAGSALPPRRVTHSLLDVYA